MITTVIIRESSRTFRNRPPFSLLWARPMGGGPRTFPGGLNKWQWKRLHEKKASQKEKRLIDHEKQLYQARLRSQIRASVLGLPEKPEGPSHSPMSPQEHIKALADRLMKPGADDLWNDDDGLVHSPPRAGPSKPNDPGIDLRKFVNDGNFQQKRGFCSQINDDGIGILMGFRGNLHQMRGFCEGNLMGFKGNLQQMRGYSGNVKGKVKKKFYKHIKGSSSSEDDEEDYGKLSSNARWPRFVLEGNEPGSGEEGGKGDVKSVRGFMGNATLGKYDVKVTKRRIVKELEEYAEQEDEEGDLAEKIYEIKQEIIERKRMEEIQEVTDRDEFVASEKRFEDCGISPLTIKALTAAGYEVMTRVQEDTLSAYLEGKDALVKSRAGTGKTTAFLLPAIETVLKAMLSDKAKRVPPIYVLILCPTRELASQIAAETRVLLKNHDGLGVQMLVGGTRFKDDQKRLELDPCQILVATPGRLLDHIETKSGLSTRLMGLKMLVLDEADHLLNLGFRKDMEKIVDCLPRRRQSLLFSATVPKEVRRISQLVLKREHAFINTVDAGSPDSSSKVKQTYIIAPHDVHFHVVYQLLKDHITEMPDYKVIVFCTTGMVTSLMYLLFREMRLNVKELHSRKPQLYRSRTVEEFKQSKRLILISSDVSARGINYPDVTLVIQVRSPSDREQYVHRLGRTGREGKDGEGILLLAPWEEHFLEDIKDLPVQRSSAPHVDPYARSKMVDSMAKIDTSVKEAAYHAWLGYYNSLREIGRDKTSLVNWANQFCESIGLEKPPALFRKTVVKMGLKDIPGIRVRK
ncbi:DEAD-box ATP-dependent RNA helicase 48-like [Chenopodium quinoa]|uniref:DEAD-box ATP-dependent RNA helicase 48-like n=1 Tax=Chenopodium quinoa TaxID=63459 RepID=UPI000B796FA6|nr:DEAD-box ATP-dependent RNA helicase 48-like [Chenopodium quinoa]